MGHHKDNSSVCVPTAMSYVTLSDLNIGNANCPLLRLKDGTDTPPLKKIGISVFALTEEAAQTSQKF